MFGWGLNISGDRDFTIFALNRNSVAKIYEAPVCHCPLVPSCTCFLGGLVPWLKQTICFVPIKSFKLIEISYCRLWLVFRWQCEKVSPTEHEPIVVTTRSTQLQWINPRPFVLLWPVWTLLCNYVWFFIGAAESWPSYFGFLRYGELLLQYSAVSFGDVLFGAFLLIPLQQRQDPQLRKMIWGENAFVLHLLPTPVEEVSIPFVSQSWTCIFS